MARRALPNYPIDGDAVYIPGSDTAWDHDRIERELDGDAEHPVSQYYSGKSRFRLEPVLEWLDMSKSPEQWHLQPLPPRIRRQVDGLLVRSARLGETDEAWSLRREAFALAAKYGAGKVENPPMEIRRTADGAVHDETLSRLDIIAPGLVDNIGAAVLSSFRALDEDEGK